MQEERVRDTIWIKRIAAMLKNRVLSSENSLMEDNYA